MMNNENNAPMIAVWASLMSNVALTILKFVTGYLFNSKVLIADAVHNAGDVIATAAAVSSMHISKRPADEDHPYGHGKAEVLGSGIVAFILGLAAIYMGYHAFSALFDPPEKASFIAWIAAFISLVWKQWLYLYTLRIGKKSNSKGLIATAYDHLADVYASIAAVAGIGLSLMGEYWDITYLSYGDPVAGIIVSALVLKLAFHMGKETADILMEKNVSEDIIADYASLIKTIPQVKRIDRLRAREHGHYILVDVRVSVPAQLTVQEGHNICREIKKVIMTKHPNVDEVLVHLNPWHG